MRAPDMRLLERGHVITPTARRAPPKRERAQRRRDWGRWGRDTAWGKVLTAAQKQAVSQEILLWMTPSENLTALQTSVCSELLSPTRAD